VAVLKLSGLELAGSNFTGLAVSVIPQFYP
jgi:hypothetical protein